MREVDDWWSGLEEPKAKEVSPGSSLRESLRRMLPTAASGELLSESIDRLAAQLEDGTICPCCSKWAKSYDRNLNGTMARGLIWLVQTSEGDLGVGQSGWVDVPNRAPQWLTKTNQHTTLRWWGLLEKGEMTREDQESTGKKDSGFWRPTSKGVAFAKGQISVPYYARTYNGQVIELTGKSILIQDVLGKRFDYNEIMGIKMSGVEHE